MWNVRLIFAEFSVGTFLAMKSAELLAILLLHLQRNYGDIAANFRNVGSFGISGKWKNADILVRETFIWEGEDVSWELIDVSEGEHANWKINTSFLVTM